VLLETKDKELSEARRNQDELRVQLAHTQATTKRLGDLLHSDLSALKSQAESIAASARTSDTSTTLAETTQLLFTTVTEFFSKTTEASDSEKEKIESEHCAVIEELHARLLSESTAVHAAVRQTEETETSLEETTSELERVKQQLRECRKANASELVRRNLDVEELSTLKAELEKLGAVRLDCEGLTKKYEQCESALRDANVRLLTLEEENGRLTAMLDKAALDACEREKAIKNLVSEISTDTGATAGEFLPSRLVLEEAMMSEQTPALDKVMLGHRLGLTKLAARHRVTLDEQLLSHQVVLDDLLLTHKMSLDALSLTRQVELDDLSLNQKMALDALFMDCQVAINECKLARVTDKDETERLYQTVVAESTEKVKELEERCARLSSELAEATRVLSQYETSALDSQIVRDAKVQADQNSSADGTTTPIGDEKSSNNALSEVAVDDLKIYIVTAEEGVLTEKSEGGEEEDCGVKDSVRAVAVVDFKGEQNVTHLTGELEEDGHAWALCSELITDEEEYCETVSTPRSAYHDDAFVTAMYDFGHQTGTEVHGGGGGRNQELELVLELDLQVNDFIPIERHEAIVAEMRDQIEEEKASAVLVVSIYLYLWSS